MAKIGKYVIDSLTRSMYEDSRCIYREYIQNAADQIDIAREQHLEENDYYEVHVRIFRNQKRIEIEDTATGVSAANRESLKDVATSQKERGKRKGFRGIGRLGGLGYCTTLTFETSYKGEDVKTLMHWDAAKMNHIVDDEFDESEAGNVIDDCTSFDELPEKADKHYFKVIMENVTDDRLLDVNNIRKYLSMVAPVDYPTQFGIFSSQIKRYIQNNGIELDVYNVYVGDEFGEEQIYKGYTTKIEDARNGDYDIKNIKIFDKKDSDGKIIYWGWYSISELRGQIPANNIAYGIRLRCKNIQLGDERTTRNFFVAEGDKRFAQYFFGELHVETPLLMPDARRDYLRECEYRSTFEEMVRRDFTTLKDLCNEASNIRGIIKNITKAEEGQKTIVKKHETSSYLSQKEIEDDNAKFERLKKNKEKALQQFKKKKQETEQNGSPLGFIYGTLPTPEPTIQTTSASYIGATDDNNQYPTVVADNPAEPTVDNQQPKLRTDNALYNKFGEKEKNVINAIYNAIYNAIADEDMREGLIKKIEKELTK